MRKDDADAKEKTRSEPHKFVSQLRYGRRTLLRPSAADPVLRATRLQQHEVATGGRRSHHKALNANLKVAVRRQCMPSSDAQPNRCVCLCVQALGASMAADIESLAKLYQSADCAQAKRKGRER